MKTTLHHNARSGFTLVETLVAIAILMIAVAGPLTVANQALTAALGARDTMIASYLAEEGMESIKNIKDNNVASGSEYTAKLYPSSCTSNNYCAVPDADSLFVGDITSGQFCSSMSGCLLYSDPTGGSVKGYYYSSSPGSNIRTRFTRYYYITGYTATDMTVIIVVKWFEGTVPNAVTLQEYMSSSAR